MRKVIRADSFDFSEPVASWIPICSYGVDRGFVKSARILAAELKAITPDPKFAYLHINALGASERYGPNKNADGFTRGTLDSSHDTFVKHAKVYKEHDANPTRASGLIKHSGFNPDMDRVELIIGVDQNKWSDELQKIASDQPVGFSMGCNIDYDVCSICGNKAPTRDSYCEHMRKNAGRVLDDGQRVYVDNPHPDFFDISGVKNPADVIAYHLQKAASAGVITGAELAEIKYQHRARKMSSCIGAKSATLAKLSEMEKRLEMQLAPGSVEILSGLPRSTPADVRRAKDLAHEGIEPGLLVRELARRKISLPLDLFLAIVTGTHADLAIQTAVEQYLPAAFTNLAKDPAELCDGTFDPASPTATVPSKISDIFDALAPSCSATMDGVAERPRHVQVTLIKSAGLRRMPQVHTMQSSSAAELAKEYARFKLACATAARDEYYSTIAVLQNFVSRDA